MTSLAAEPTQAHIRPIEPGDNAHLAEVLRRVLTEFGANSEGFAFADPEIDRMYETYQAPRSKFYVVDIDGEIVGGGGLSPLKGGDERTCELQKFYFLRWARGHGYGWETLNRCLQDAKNFGYKRCYLETLKGMDNAVALYTKNGFKALEGPLGDTGHFKCNAWFAKELD